MSGLHSAVDRSGEKQELIDLAERIRSETGKKREILRQALEDGAASESEQVLSTATRQWAIATVLLGSGAEHLDAVTKRSLSSSIIDVAARIIDEWTRIQARCDFGTLREDISKENVLSSFPGEIDLDEKRRFAVGVVDLVEHAAVADPLRRVVGYLCEQARHRVLATSVENAKVDGLIERVIHGTWLTDIDSDRGRAILNKAIRALPSATFFRVTMTSHYLSRVYWNHWKPQDRMCLLEVADEMIKSLKLTFDKPRLKRIIEHDQKKGARNKRTKPQR